MDSIAKGDFHEVGASYYRNPKNDTEYDSTNNRRYFLSPPTGLNPGNLYVGNSPLPFKPPPSNVSKCEVFSSSEVPRTPRIDTKSKKTKTTSIIAVIGHSTRDNKAENKFKKKEKKVDQFEYYSRFEPSKPVSNAFSKGKVHTQASKRRSLSCSESSAMGSAGSWGER